jgi:6-phosphogluconolactonase
MELRLRVYDDLETLTRAAADDIAALLLVEANPHRSFNLALSGGGTPRGLYALLAQPPYAQSLPWSRLHFFWGDERCVSAEHPESNYGQANEALLRHVPAPVENIHRVRVELSPAEAAADYARQLSQYADPGLRWPRFDLVLLGLGEDGHTASLFPGMITQREKRSPVLSVQASYLGRPADRVTLTPLVLNDARHIIFLVAGESKAQAVRAVLKGHADPEQIPASRIRPISGVVTWMLDRAAAKLLT